MKVFLISFLLLPFFVRGAESPLIIDHRHTDITKLPAEQILQAKAVLKIGYGHTSHGSQISSGMKGLVRFADQGGLGLQLPKGIFSFTPDGAKGSLFLQEGGSNRGTTLRKDCGYWPLWEDETRKYLQDPANKEINVVMWSWCGQMPGKFRSGKLHSEYLEPMSRLEKEFPHVVFVYMTGHADYKKFEDHKQACETIRKFCKDNNKVLYDFADIEQWNPDGTYFEFVNDDCSYWKNANGGPAAGNWALEWQKSHEEGVDWYRCSSAHSQAVNANQKAYAAWALWVALGERMK